MPAEHLRPSIGPRSLTRNLHELSGAGAPKQEKWVALLLQRAGCTGLFGLIISTDTNGRCWPFLFDRVSGQATGVFTQDS